MKASHPAVMLGGAVVCAGLGLGLPQLLPERIPALVSGLLVGTGLGLGFAALLRWRLPDSCDVATASLRRRYTREMLLAMGAYVVVLLASITVLRRVEDMDPLLRAVVALLPVPPIAFALRAIVRYIRDVDELQQRIELEAVSIATAFVCLLYMAGGFLQLAKVIDVPAGAAMIWVFPLVCFAYGLAKVAVSRRYQ
jgi:hypothetical protein